jgi:hypothetical protein
MKSPSFAMLRTLLPLLVLGCFVVYMWLQDPGAMPSSDKSPVATDDSGRFTKEDFAQVPIGGLPVGWEAPRGAFGVVEGASGRVLEFGPEPMVEGRVLLPGVLTGGGMVRARMQGERAKRTFPRFGVGLGQDVAYKLQALPGEGQLRLVEAKQLLVNGKPVEEDTVLVTVPWTWEPNAWCWVELSVKASENGSAWEGRAWAEGATRPTEAMLNFTTASPPKLVRATIHVAPFALKPIYIDRVETQRPGK